MKKILPIMFISSTALIAVAGFVVSSNGGFSPLKAEDNSHTYTHTFYKEHIDATQNELITTGDPEVAKFYFSKLTASGSKLGCYDKAIAKGDVVHLDGEHMVDVESWDEWDEDEYDKASFDITFRFEGVLSAVSVKVIGHFQFPNNYWYHGEEYTEFEFTGGAAVDGVATINASKNEMNSFYISSIVVSYTCTY